MKLDRTKPYGEIIGANDGSKYEQNGIVFDFNGNPLNAPEVIEEEVKRKPGRPPKGDK